MDDLQDAEFSLIEGRWRASLDPEVTSHPALQLAHDVVHGKLKEVLTSDAAISVLASKPSSSFSFSSIQIALSGSDAELSVLALGAAVLHAFIQINWTGPSLELSPSSLLFRNDSPSSTVDDVELDRIAIEELTLGGEPAYHLTKSASLLRLAQRIFDAPFQHCKTAIWWRLRALKVHEQLLDESVAAPESFLQSLDHFASEHLSQYPTLRGRFLLETGILRHQLRDDKAAAQLFVRASELVGLRYELSGALGKRTKFQVNELSQLVLLAETIEPENVTGNDSHARLSESPEEPAFPTNLLLNDDTLLEQTQFTISPSLSTSSSSLLSHISLSSQPKLPPLSQSILLALCLNLRNTLPSHGLTTEQMTPYVARVLENPMNWSVYTMTLLLRSRLESTRTRTVERSTLQLQALIDQIPTADSTVQERLEFFHCLHLPSQWLFKKELGERYLSLGVVRSALEIFEKLEMWDEVVKCWVSLERPEKGTEIVQELLKGTKEEAEDVITRKRAEPGASSLNGAEAKGSTSASPLSPIRRAQLWCILGDLDLASSNPSHPLAQSHYRTALKIHPTSSRGLRSLGFSLFTSPDSSAPEAPFAQCIPYLRQAAQLNPLNFKTHFILGCAYVKLEDWEKARESFQHCVNLEDDDAESWSNLATCWIRIADRTGVDGKAAWDSIGTEGGQVRYASSSVSHNLADESLQGTDGSFSRSPLTLAHTALRQAVKHNYSNWRIWSNYMYISLRVQDFAEACRAMGRVVEERSEKEKDIDNKEKLIDLDVLEGLLQVVITFRPSQAKGNPESAEAVASHSNLLKRLKYLFEEQLLPRISTSARIYQYYADFQNYRQQYPSALDAYVTAYRLSVTNDGTVENDVERWREAVDETRDVIRQYEELGPKIEGEDGKGKWRFQARSLLRSFMSRTKDSFDSEPEWANLVEIQDELKT